MFKSRRSKKASKKAAARRKVDANASNGGSVLYKAIEQRQWSSALSRIHHAPHEVSTYIYRITSSTHGPQFKFMTLPLHEACMRKPPTLIVSSLIAAFPDAVTTKCDDTLPLHHAIKYSASLDIIEMLVAGDPDSINAKDSSGLLPLELFGQNKTTSWSDETRESISKILTMGVEGIDLSNSDIISVISGKSMGADDAEKDQAAIQDELTTSLDEEGWKKSGLIVVVVGASGDLVKKKTYPSLLHLYEANLLPSDTIIWGFARTKLSHDELRQRLKPYLEEKGNFATEIIDSFLSKCFY
jgi:hypothetical protein